MTNCRRSVSLALACFAVLHSAAGAAEYVGPDTAPSSPSPSTAPSTAPSATDDLRRVPRNAFQQDPAVGVPVRSIFRDTRAPYYDQLRDLTLSPSARMGDSVEVRANLDLPDFRGSFPLLQRGFAPEDADLKIGPVYFKLRQISAAALYSDNIYHSDDRKEGDVIGIVSIGGQILAQLSEGFQIAAAGNFVYLPFEGRGGFGGYALRAPYAFGVSATPIAQTQMVWQPTLFGLPLTIADEFRMGMAQFRNGAYDGFAAFEGGDFDSYDRAGVYVLRTGRFPRGDEFDRRDIDEETEFVYYANELSLSTGAPIAGQNVFRFRASHENIWYDEDRERFTLPSVRDRVVASIHSVRENLRFKPYVRYEYFHRDNPDVYSHQGWVGAEGPITDLLYFRGEVGVLWRTDLDTQDLVWRAGLYHHPSPYTWHSLVYARATSEYQDELDQHITYRIHKTLGPELTASAYTSYHWIDDLFDSTYDRTEWRNGLRLTYQASPKTTFRATAEHVSLKYENEDGDSESWRGRFECSHHFYDRLLARAVYQYQVRESDVRRRSYHENLAYLSLSWLFD
jgi:hypothetical protein